MFGSEMLDVVIGIIFVFLTLSLVCSAVNEIIEAWLNKRADYLERGIKELLTDESGSGYASEIYKHPLIAGLFRGEYTNEIKGWRKRIPPRLLGILHELGFKKTYLPSYIPAQNFALALLDIIQNPAAVEPPLPGYDAADPKARTKRAVEILIKAAGDNPAKARENIENWYNSSMDRVSGWYKRRTQVIILALGLFVTIVVNADAIAISNGLSRDKALRSSLLTAAQEYAKADASGMKSETAPSPSASPGAKSSPTPAPVTTPVPSQEANAPASCKENKNAPKCKLDTEMQRLESLGLPIGWDWNDSRLVPKTFGGVLLKLAGWLITAFAITLGAPFWFDLLNMFMVVRSTVKPKEKSPEEPAKPGQD